MRRFGVFLSISSIYAMTISSMAATLAPQGSILVNRGQGFQPVSAATEILPGDTILVNAGAKAAVTFGSVCSMQFPVAGSYSIPTETQCLVAQQNAANLANSSPSGLTSTYGVTPVAGVGTAVPASLAVTGLIVGGVVAGGILVAKELAASN